MVDAAVDPANIPSELSQGQLEWWVLFGICVANKPAKATEEKMKRFMAMSIVPTPFGKVRSMIRHGLLGRNIREARFGQYARIERAFRAAVDLDLDRLTVESLESVPGIGPKTARMVMLYAFPGFQGAPLDTHILKWLKSLGHKAPKGTPPAGPTYARLEKAVQKEAALRGLSVRELDTMVWKHYALGEPLPPAGQLWA